MKKLVLLCLALTLCLPVPLSAQGVALGSRVRVNSKSGTTTGLLLAMSKESLLVGASNRYVPVSVTLADVNSFEVSLSEQSRRGAMFGGQVGLAGGALVFTLMHLSTRTGPRSQYEDVDVAIAAGTGAALGFVTGIVMGAAASQEKWGSAAFPTAADALPPRSEWVALQTQSRLGLFSDGRAIRVHTQDGRRIEGRYDGQADGLVRIASDSSYLIPITRIAEISERRPLTGLWLKRGAWIGAAIGFATIAGVAANTDDCDPDSCLSPWALTVPFTVYGALGGAAFGAILGSHVKGWRTQKW